MAGHIRRFTNANVATTGASITSKRIPCYGARSVVARVTSGTAEGVATAAFAVCPGSTNVGASTGGQGYTERGSMPNTLTFGPATRQLSVADGALLIFHPWCEITITHASSFTGPINIDFDVFYDSEAAMQRGEQSTLAMV